MSEGSGGLSGLFNHDPSTVRSVYDHWASGYNADLAEWGYTAPQVAVGLLKGHVSTEAQLLDVGCGTGLVGAELAATGFHDVVGIDMSSQSLDIAAASQNYRAVAEHDLTSLPTPLLEQSFGGLLCVGVLAYLPDIEATCREFCRVVEPGGTIVVTERSDLFIERGAAESMGRGTSAVFDQLEADGLWSIIEVTPSLSYLPGLDDYAGIGVHYGVFTRL